MELKLTPSTSVTGRLPKNGCNGNKRIPQNTQTKPRSLSACGYDDRVTENLCFLITVSARISFEFIRQLDYWMKSKKYTKMYRKTVT